MVELPIRVNAFVYRVADNSFEFLCIKRVPEDGGFWQTVTGTVHDDDSLIETIVRELSEECDIDFEKIIKIDGPVYDFEWIKAGKKIREFVYVVLVKEDIKIALNPDEHDDFLWCGREELLKRLEKEDNVKAAREVVRFLNSF